MNIAILIYGRLRNCKHYYEDLMDSVGRENNIHFFMSSDESTENDLRDFIELYKPIAYCNDKCISTYDISKYPNAHETTSDRQNKMLRHFINKYRVFRLLEEYTNKKYAIGIEYDVIVSFRVDIKIAHGASFNFTNISKNDNDIYIPNGWDFRNGVNDQIAYGNYNVMQKYMNIYSNVEYILENKLSIVHPESLTLANIKFAKLNIRRVQLNYELKPNR